MYGSNWGHEIAFENENEICILRFTACLLKPQGILNSQGRFAFVSKSIHLVYLVLDISIVLVYYFWV